MASPSKISKFPGPEPRPLVTPVDVAELLREGNDPTREIRRYVEQLQEVSREAYTRQTALEEERDRLHEDMSRLRKDCDALRDECRDMRRERDAMSERAGQYDSMIDDLKHRLESVERARVDATRQRDDTMKFYKESQRQIEETLRVKDEAIKQRDAYSRQRDTAKKDREDLATRLAQVEAQLADARKVATDFNRDDFQKQLMAIRQARDASATQCAELKLRISQLEDDVAILTYDRDTATQTASRAHEEAGKLKALMDQALADAAVRDEASKDEVEELRKKNAALKRRNATLGESLDALTTEAQTLKAQLEAATSSHEMSAGELRREIEKLAQERETEVMEFGTKLDELRAAQTKELQLARQQYEAAMNERDAARTRAQEREAELEGLRGQLDEARLAATRLGSEAAERTQELEMMRKHRERAEAAERALVDLQVTLTTSRQHADQLLTNSAAMEGQIASQSAQMDGLRRQLDETEKKLSDFRDLQKEHEEHRLQMIEVAARLATAQGEIKELSASLAEARLKIKGPSRSSFDAGNEEIDSMMRVSLSSLRRTFQEYLRQPAEFNFLNELQNHAQNLADRARELNFMTVQRVSGVLAALTRELYDVPELATPTTMRSVGQGIEFIASLLREQNVDQRVDLGHVQAFAVDDDHSVLDSICEALQAAGLGAATTDSAGAALAELASSAYDLIILDVNLPELDGLELCSHVREMPLHGTTPVIFITGQASLENRVQFSLRGGNELMIKPFNLLELALRSVTLIIKSKLKANPTVVTA